MRFMFGGQADSEVFKPRLGKWSSLSLYLFWTLVLLLVGGLLSTLWPIVDVVISPQVDQMRLSTAFHVSLDLANSQPSSWLVSGRLLRAGEDWSALQRANYKIFPVGKQNIVVAENDLQFSLNKFINQNIPPDYAVAPDSVEILWLAPVADKSEQGLTAAVNIGFSIYRRFPVDDWKVKLAGIKIPAAVDWLEKQTGVKKANINLKPHFLANIRQIMPTNPNVIRFTLDINGKTSILK